MVGFVYGLAVNFQHFVSPPDVGAKEEVDFNAGPFIDPESGRRTDSTVE